MTNRNDLHKLYIESGFKIIELKGKKPFVTGWQEDSYPGEQTIREQFNVGVVLGDQSGGLLDIDLDDEIAVRIAHHFLPSTEMVFGRNSNPKSHFVYTVKDCGDVRQFKHPDYGTIVEYRANGGQTMFPPSVHPETGEVLHFDSYGEPAQVEAQVLLDAACDIAISSILIIRWIEGSRHEKSLAVAGLLRKAGFSVARVKRIIKAVVSDSRDNELDDRLRAVDSTFASELSSVAGYSSLVASIGEQDASSISRWAGLEPPRPDGRPTRDSSHVSLDSDGDHAVAFAQRYQGELRHCSHNSQWYVKEHGVFVPIHQSRVQGMALDFGNELIAEGKLHHRDSRSALNRNRINNAIELARSKMAVEFHQLDSRSDLVGCLNGVIDLKTGTITDDASAVVTKRLNATFDPSAKCERFLKFLGEIFPGDKDVIQFVQRVVGYSLSGSTEAQAMFFFVGKGANGKSTLLEVLGGLFGDYGGVTPIQTLMTSKYGNERNDDLANLAGVRLARAAEGESGSKFATAKVKLMTGGDTISCRRLYENQFSYRPQFKLLAATNELPIIDEGGDAIWRRIHVVRFPISIPADMRNGNLVAELSLERSGILNWALEGYKDFKAQGLNPPSAVVKETSSYRENSDTVKIFVDSACVNVTNAFIGTSALHHAYESFCGESGIEPLPVTKFGKELSRLGFEPKRKNTGNGWVGLMVRDKAKGGLGSME
jgi:putative DNA primase/helicase